MIKPLIILLLSVVCLSACTATIPQSVNETPLTYISTLDKNASFAATPGGDVIAYNHRGFKLLDTASGLVKVLATRKPDFLAWSIDGRQLASATIESDASSRVTIYSKEGAFLRDFELPVVLNGLKWTAQGDLLATGYLLKVYSFGSNLRQGLYRISGEQVNDTTLTDTTLKPTTSKVLAPVMGSVLQVHFSTYGDDLTYVRLHDPPEFTPYLALVYRNWQAGGERVLQKFPLQALRIRAGNKDDELEILSRDGLSAIRLWPELIEEKPTARPYRFIDGKLTQDGVELGNWGKGSHFQLMNDGKYLLGVENKLFLGAGLQPAMTDIYNEKKWLLRRWRHEGLMSNDEYHQMLKELSP